MSPNPHPPERVPVARVITRLNIGGPSIQAVRLTTALEPYGFSTVLYHGRLGAGEGDMSYLISTGADARFIDTLCRPLSPIDDVRALLRLYREFRRVRPRIVHTHMAKAGMLGRLAAAAYNLTQRRADRAHVVHTYHGHVLEGYFGPATARFIALERGLARVSDRIIPSRAIRSGCCRNTASGATASTESSRSDSIVAGRRRQCRDARRGPARHQHPRCAGRRHGAADRHRSRGCFSCGRLVSERPRN